MILTGKQWICKFSRSRFYKIGVFQLLTDLSLLPQQLARCGLALIQCFLVLRIRSKHFWSAKSKQNWPLLWKSEKSSIFPILFCLVPLPQQLQWSSKALDLCFRPCSIQWKHFQVNSTNSSPVSMAFSPFRCSLFFFFFFFFLSYFAYTLIHFQAFLLPICKYQQKMFLIFTSPSTASYQKWLLKILLD